MKRFLAIVLCAIVGWSGVARPELLQLSGDAFVGSDNFCYIADPGPGGTVTVYVLLKFTTGATGVSFSAPVSPYAGLQFVGDVLPPGFTAVGDSQTQVDVSFGCSASGSLLVMEMHFVRVGNADACVSYSIQPGASMFDCSLVEKSNIDSEVPVGLNTSGPCSAPYRHPFPADGAVDVPLRTVLDWVGPDGVGYCFTPIAAAPAVAAAFGKVYFGTTTNPPYDPLATYNHGVGPLQPATTYYWKINAELSPPYSSPLWSFTTISTVATEQSTWGAIKALYR